MRPTVSGESAPRRLISPGIALSATFLLARLCRKTSFGTPYFLPFSPLAPIGLADGVTVNPKAALKHANRELKEEKP